MRGLFSTVAESSFLVVSLASDSIVSGFFTNEKGLSIELLYRVPVVLMVGPNNDFGFGILLALKENGFEETEKIGFTSFSRFPFSELGLDFDRVDPEKTGLVEARKWLELVDGTNKEAALDIDDGVDFSPEAEVVCPKRLGDWKLGFENKLWAAGGLKDCILPKEPDSNILDGVLSLEVVAKRLVESISVGAISSALALGLLPNGNIGVGVDVSPNNGV